MVGGKTSYDLHMNPLSFVYTELLWRPLFNVLVGLTSAIPGHYMWVSIVLVTALVRLILLPLSLKQAHQAQKNQGKMAGLQAELAAIKKQHPDDKQKQSAATMTAYRKAGVNPASGCLVLLIQLPILIALYRVFLTHIGPESAHLLYSFVHLPEMVNLSFLGATLDQPSLRLAIVAGVMQFIQVRFFSPTPTPSPAAADDDSAKVMASMQRNMAYIFPAMTVFISLRLPSALALYWIISITFAIVQQKVLQKTLHLSSPPATV